MSKERHYAVDQIKGAVAVLLDEEQHQIVVPLTRLPRSSKNGIVLTVPIDETGTPDWSGAAIDEAEANRRSQATEKEPQELSQQDSAQGESNPFD
jgi:hypothetical protein